MYYKPFSSLSDFTDEKQETFKVAPREEKIASQTAKAKAGQLVKDAPTTYKVGFVCLFIYVFIFICVSNNMIASVSFVSTGTVTDVFPPTTEMRDI